VRSRKVLAAAFASAGLAGGDALAVSLSDDGLGQALIYPYYTAQFEAGSYWNTILSVVNTQPVAKALRVRVREGRNGREIASINLYLAPNDVWVAFLVPRSESGSSGGKLATADASCTYPPIPANGIFLSNAMYSAANNDGFGTGLDRTLEGYVEMIEMASFAPGSATELAVTAPYENPNCGVVQTAVLTAVLADARPPTGGLSGMLTNINVNTGLDAGVSAVALADLATAPYLRDYVDPYPGFGAAEVTPVSRIVADGIAYDLRWANGVDAVSSVFMSAEVMNEFVLDPATNSRTDWVLTFPTRPYTTLTTRPFAPETFHLLRDYYDREGNVRSEVPGETCSFANAPCPPVRFESVAGAFPVGHRGSAASLLGSKTGLRLGEIVGYDSGWMRVRVAEVNDPYGHLRSEPGSTATDLATGAITAGAFEVRGLPWTGFMMHTFSNGTLTCPTSYSVPTPVACQGNYGGSFPHRYRRLIEPGSP
jgi:hypothetical protein